MKKSFASLLFVLFFLFPVNASGGLMAGQGQVRSVSTKYFEILFTQKTEQSAFILLQHADEIYEELRALFEIESYSDFRIPVVLTSSTDEYNAYFTNYNFNHIVLFDVLISDTYAVFEDTLLDTFRHELTHALLINLRNSFWQGFDSVMGDLYNWGCYVVMPTLIKEGASIYAESYGGYGRLNDGYYLHAVRQAKLQGSFPRVGDVSGARDIYPWENVSYQFGGPFTQWLIEKYGMQKYVLFWDNAVNMKSFVFAQAFKKAYGIKLTDAWNDFYASIEVPLIEKEPLQNEAVSSFDTSVSDGKLYSSLCSCDKGIAYLNQTDGSVWYASFNEDGSVAKARLLFSKTGAKRIALSKDGQYLAVCYSFFSGSLCLSRTCIYSFEKDSWTELSQESVSDIGFARFNGQTALCLLHAEGSVQNLSVFTLTPSSFGRVACKCVFEKKLARGCVFFSPCDGGTNTLAFLCRKNALWSLVLLSLTDGSFYEAPVSDFPLSVRSLSFCSEENNEVSLCFSWCSKNSFPRLGMVTISREMLSFSFMNSDLSGGVYVPVSVDGRTFLYAADFVTGSSLYKLDASKLSFDSVQKKLLPSSDFEYTESFVTIDSLSWNHLYYGKGTLVPFSNIKSYGRTGSVASRIIFPGLTWMTNTVWDSDEFSASLGVNPGGGFLSPLQSKDFELAAQIHFGSGQQPSFLQYNANAQVFFNQNGFSQVSADLALKTALPFANNMSLVLQNESLLLYTKERLSFSDTFIAQLGFIHQSGSGRYAQAGCALQFVFDAYFEHALDDSFELTPLLNCYPALIVRLPQLLPFTCGNGITANLPFRAQFLFYPSKSMPVDLQLTTVVFSWDIQKGFVAFPLYLNCITLACKYECLLQLVQGQEVFWDVASTELLLDFAYNSGAAASRQALITLGLCLDYFPRKTSGIPFTLSLKTSFIF